MARFRTVLAIVLVVVILVVLAAATAYYLSLPPSGGTWSAALSGVCAYDARYFWQSATLGPRLATTTGLAATSVQTVQVAWATAPLNLLYEFPDDANASVSVSLADGLPFFVQANATGSVPTGFLPTDAAGNPGYNFTVSGFTRMNGTSPFAIYYPTAVVYRVQDENGNSVVYATPGTLQASLSGVSAVDPLNRTAAIAEVQAAGGIPYIQVAGRATITTPFNVTNATHALLGTVGTFYGSSLQDYVTVRTNSTLYLGVDLTLRNTSNRNACFVVDAQGSVVHAWYYALGTCP